jgi:hypothetical protein
VDELRLSATVPERQAMKVTFSTTLLQAESKNATGISVPPDLVAALGSGKRPAVKVHVGTYMYRSTVAPYGDVFMVSLSAEHRAKAGVQAGDTLEVTLELDTEPRTVTLPDDLLSALSTHNLIDVFEQLAPSKRKEAVRQVESAKAADTRARRIANIVAQLQGG